MDEPGFKGMNGFEWGGNCCFCSPELTRLSTGPAARLVAWVADPGPVPETTGPPTLAPWRGPVAIIWEIITNHYKSSLKSKLMILNDYDCDS